jgi:peptidoglycan-associated lipoprotein
MKESQMITRILSLITLLLFSVGVIFAQSNLSIQLDSSQASESTGSNSPEDAKLIAAPPVPPVEQQQFQQAIKDIHFDFDRAELRPEDRAILASDAEWLKSHPDVLITLEGDADERGDIVYNVALSGERAKTARDALVDLGVAADRIAFATGWGKLYPVCPESNESCWSQNRRTHISTWPPEEAPAQVASR